MLRFRYLLGRWQRLSHPLEPLNTHNMRSLRELARDRATVGRQTVFQAVGSQSASRLRVVNPPSVRSCRRIHDTSTTPAKMAKESKARKSTTLPPPQPRWQRSRRREKRSRRRRSLTVLPARRQSWRGQRRPEMGGDSTHALGRDLDLRSPTPELTCRRSSLGVGVASRASREGHEGTRGVRLQRGRSCGDTRRMHTGSGDARAL